MTLEQREIPRVPDIKHSSYEAGAVQSLGFKMANGREATVGVIRGAGNWDFGEAQRTEEITITSGGITGIGVKDGFYRVGDELTFKKGEKIQFETSGPVSYLCVYGD